MTTLLFPFLSFPSSRVNQPLFSIFFVSIFFQIYIQSLVRGKRIRSGDKFCQLDFPIREIINTVDENQIAKEIS